MELGSVYFAKRLNSFIQQVCFECTYMPGARRKTVYKVDKSLCSHGGGIIGIGVIK